MKLALMTVAITFCIMTIGCQENTEKKSNNHAINKQLVQSYNDTAIQNAIVTQHTLFPYHFVTNGAELNELGQRDLSALISHFLKYPGRINIRQQNTAAKLYEARVNLVRDRLQQAGIAMERISISDDMPGGSGITSERVLVILQQAPRRSAGGTTTSTSAGIR